MNQTIDDVLEKLNSSDSKERKQSFLAVVAENYKLSQVQTTDLTFKQFSKSLTESSANIENLTSKQLNNLQKDLTRTLKTIEESSFDNKDLIVDAYKKQISAIEADKHDERKAKREKLAQGVGKSASDVFDVRSMYATTVGNDPIAGAIFKLTSSAIGGVVSSMKENADKRRRAELQDRINAAQNDVRTIGGNPAPAPAPVPAPAPQPVPTPPRILPGMPAPPRIITSSFDRIRANGSSQLLLTETRRIGATHTEHLSKILKVTNKNHVELVAIRKLLGNTDEESLFDKLKELLTSLLAFKAALGLGGTLPDIDLPGQNNGRGRPGPNPGPNPRPGPRPPGRGGRLLGNVGRAIGGAARGAAGALGSLGTAAAPHAARLAGPAAAVAGAGYAGWEVGSAINEKFIEGTKFQDVLGEGLTRAMAALGNEEAKETLAQVEKNKKQQDDLKQKDIAKEDEKTKTAVLSTDENIKKLTEYFVDDNIPVVLPDVNPAKPVGPGAESAKEKESKFLKDNSAGAQLQGAAKNLTQETASQAKYQPTNKGESAQGASPDAKLGSLSAKYESGKRGSDAIGHDSKGGTSYGKYQISSKAGTMSKFLKHAEESGYKDVADRLRAAGAETDTGSTSGSAVDAWKSEVAANPKLMGDLERGFIQKTHYAPAAAKAEKLGFDMNNRATQDMVWSGSVQHGEVNKILEATAADPKFAKMSNDEKIETFYQKRKDHVTNNTNLSEKEKASVLSRYDREVVDAKGMNKVQNTETRLPSGDAALPSTLPKSVENMPIKDSQGVTRTPKEMGITSWEDLHDKGGQAFAGGENDPATLYATSKIAEGLGSNFDRVTAQNDKWHQDRFANTGKDSDHRRGNKTDFTVKGMDSAAANAKIEETMTKQGLVKGEDYKVLDEYKQSTGGTGGHFDFKLTKTGQEKMNASMQAEQAAKEQVASKVEKITTPQPEAKVESAQQTAQPTKVEPAKKTFEDLASSELEGNTDQAKAAEKKVVVAAQPQQQQPQARTATAQAGSAGGAGLASMQVRNNETILQQLQKDILSSTFKS